VTVPEPSRVALPCVRVVTLNDALAVRCPPLDNDRVGTEYVMPEANVAVLPLTTVTAPVPDMEEAAPKV
jgi:hypothetical protein